MEVAIVVTDLILGVSVDVPEEDCSVESRGCEVLFPSRVLDVFHPVDVAVQGTHLVLQVSVEHTTVHFQLGEDPRFWPNKVRT